MMRFPVSLSASLVAVAALVVCAGVYAQAPAPSEPTPDQPTPTQPTSTQPTAGQPTSGQSSSSSVQTPATSTAPNGTYVAIDPLANVRYDNRYDVSVGMAYDHIKAGPNLLQGSNLGGLDVTGSYWFAKRWAAEGSARGYVGTSGAAPNDVDIRGPFVAQYVFAAGPEWLGPHNRHGALIAHVLAGGAYGKFQQDLRGTSPSVVGFYNDQLAPAMIMGGHIDLNRSPRWVFRITPDAIATRYTINYPPKTNQIDVNFAISVGIEYKFKKKR